ncbi:MAG: dienelactone hydrolase family protein [Isosphaeraceae bacterium]
MRDRRWIAQLTALLLASIGAPSIVRAQDARYELGRRVRQFELRWKPDQDPASLRAVVDPLSQAVSRFFRFQFGEAGRALTEAELALAPKSAPSNAELWARSLRLRPSQVLIDPEAGTLRVTLEAFYPSHIEPPKDLQATLRFVRTVDGAKTETRAAALGQLPSVVSFPLKGQKVPRGDGRLELALTSEGRTIAGSPWAGLSVVDNLEGRLKAAAARIATWPTDGTSDSADRATARSLHGILAGLAQGRVPETDYPAARLLDELDAQIRAIDAGERWHGPTRPGEFWLTLPIPSGRKATVRILVPPIPPGSTPPPLVVALHGAGGSENMFFDSYGAGAIVSECRRRGWVLVAPRAGERVDQVVEAVGTLYPIDAKRVFLVGHSMGAAMAVQAAVEKPARYAGVAALGGGGRVRGSDGLRALPVFVGVGSRDFARAGAKSLADAFEAAGGPTTFREYPEVEHLGIVQVALPDVFRWFETIRPASR